MTSFNDLWHSDPTQRLKAARILSGSREVAEAISKLGVSAPGKAWPKGMPTVVNPYLLFVGPSPGNSPAMGKCIFDYTPTCGVPPAGFNYPDSRHFWNKFREATVFIMGSLHGINGNDALSLAGLVNLDSRGSGRASNVRYLPEHVKWVWETTVNRLKPRIIAPIGLSSMSKSILTALDCETLPDEWFDYKDARMRGRFRIGIGSYADTSPFLVIFFPAHFSRAPLSNEGARRQVYELFVEIADRTLRNPLVTKNNRQSEARTEQYRSDSAATNFN